MKLLWASSSDVWGKFKCWASAGMIKWNKIQLSHFWQQFGGFNAFAIMHIFHNVTRSSLEGFSYCTLNMQFKPLSSVPPCQDSTGLGPTLLTHVTRLLLKTSGPHVRKGRQATRPWAALWPHRSGWHFQHAHCIKAAKWSSEPGRTWIHFSAFIATK